VQYCSIFAILVLSGQVLAVVASSSVPQLTIRNRANKEVRVDVALEPSVLENGKNRSELPECGVMRDIEVKARDSSTITLSGSTSAVLQHTSNCAFDIYGYAVSGTSYLGGAQHSAGRLVRNIEMIILDNGVYFLPAPSRL